MSLTGLEINQEKRCFHLYNDSLSLVLWVRDDAKGNPEVIQAYFGGRLMDAACCIQPCIWQEGASFDSIRQMLPYACPTDGRGDFRPPLLSLRDMSGSSAFELFYTGYEVIHGKPALEGLPATYVEDDSEAETLRIVLTDKLTGLRAVVSYTVFEAYPVLAVSTRIENQGKEDIMLEAAGSCAMTWSGSYDMIHLHGRWGQERQIERMPASCSIRRIASTRGASGHEHNPFVALCKPDTTEFHGTCFGASLVYSGSFAITVDENAYHSTRLIAGINPDGFRWKLAPDASFQTPETVLVYTEKGFNGMSQVYHELYRTRLCRGQWRDRRRPVLINNWEATYFNFDHKKIVDIARAGHELGVELFVLDDGWFGKRDDDNCSLGDWVVNRKKLPDGLGKLSEDIRKTGMMFGIWMEPEMVSPDSDLYRAHPEWCLHVDDRMRTEARNQLILDMTREDVQDYIIGAVSRVLEETRADYVKWDMNRNYAEAGSACLRDGREEETAHRYILGLYRVMKTVTERFPEVLFESCSGGGGRFDPGILYYMPQTWTSDDTDAVERLRIQYGTSYVYPSSSMGSHVSAVPNHQVGRVTPMRMRCQVAMAGNFGLELDVTKLSEEDREEIRQSIHTLKEIGDVCRKGRFTRLLSPFEGDLTVWQFVDEDQVAVFFYLDRAKVNDRLMPVRLRDLPDTAVYADREGNTFTAHDLMTFGLVPPIRNQDCASHVVVLRRR